MSEIPIRLIQAANKCRWDPYSGKEFGTVGASCYLETENITAKRSREALSIFALDPQRVQQIKTFGNKPQGPLCY